ncbi:MAG TPA: DUF885 domain-containing protein [Thermoplasmata archaeon]|nr:DUF885 domain-containing protein [Thermoplasmata archaeon]
MVPPSPPSPEFDALEQEIVDHLFRLQPSYGVGLGLHQYDGLVPDLSSVATDAWATGADALLLRLRRFGDETLSADRKVDRLLLQLLLDSPLFDLREARDYDRNPMSYLGSASLTSYLVRDYAPIEHRVDAIVRTLEAVPRLLDDGRRRLHGPLPKPFVDLSLAIGGGLPTHFGEAEEFATRSGLGPKVAAARATAQAAVAEFLAWLKNDCLPRATPEFALGAHRYQRLLWVREGIEASIDELRAAGAADLARNQARLDEIAAEEKVGIPQLLDRISRDHPTADGVLPLARQFVEETRRFVADKDLVSIPEPAVCRVEETPVWGRALSTASMNPPGPFDTGPTDGIYYVTPVDAKWTPTQAEEWLRSFNRSLLRNITVHEVYPGHYLQFLHFHRRSGSLARKVYLSPSFVEGWAHYTEQLAIEQGIGPGGHDAEVAEIHDALLRDCRLLASIGLHTQGMSIEDATQLFMREAHFERLPAEREAIRGTFNPEYYCYTLGKLAILDARRRLLDRQFHGSLRGFHDALLGFGCPPVGLLESLLGAPPAA